jgi:hypothetical protein
MKPFDIPIRKFCIASACVMLTGVLSGCAVREQAFDCTSRADPTVSNELVMTPTSARFQSIRYGFLEERGALRSYRQKETGRVLEFNPASGSLKLHDSQWQCKKYSLATEPRSRN